MAFLPVSAFQPPLPSALAVLPPNGILQWTFRCLSLLFTLYSFPLMLILVPLSIYLPPPYAPLPLHPDNLPSHRTVWSACCRGWWAYIASGFLWSLTGTGIPPDHGLGVSRYWAQKGLRHSENVALETGRPGNSAILAIFEEDVPPFPIELCVGPLAEQDLPRPSLHSFWLCSSAPSSCTPPSLDRSVTEAKKAILWLAGGGYVTGYPLNDRPIFSLARNLPVGKYAILAPCISRSLSKGRSFPVPLLDALAGYHHLRRLGFEEEDIVVVGNSAGGGLTWSLLSYLVAIQERGLGDLGAPRSVVMISPWLKLPPMEAGEYPDFVNTPQLLNAARCYLARYPMPGENIDPFRSAIYSWLAPTKKQFIDKIDLFLSDLTPRGQIRSVTSSDESKYTYSLEELVPIPPETHLGWFDSSVFTQLSTRHPLISPSTDVTSPFVRRTLSLLAKAGTRLLVHCGTAEWFYDPIVELARAAKEEGVDLTLVENSGGLHSEACLRSPERGGPAGILQAEILTFLGGSLGSDPSYEEMSTRNEPSSDNIHEQE